MWMPHEADSRMPQQEQTIQPAKMQIDAKDLAKFPGWSKETVNQYISSGWTIEQLKEYYDGQVANHFKPVVDNQMSVMMVNNTKKPKKLVWITFGALLPIIVVFLIFVGMVSQISSMLWKRRSITSIGNMVQPEDTLTLYSNGTASDTTGVIVAWDISNGNLSTTFLIVHDSVEIFWKYEIISTSNDHRLIVMAPFTEIEDGEVVVDESGCIGYMDTIKGAESEYFSNQLASLPSWCDPD